MYQNINPSRFLMKIPNMKVMREFLVNDGKYYVPEIRTLTNAFLRVTFFIHHINLYKDVISGNGKKLFKASEINWVDHVPRWP